MPILIGFIVSLGPRIATFSRPYALFIAQPKDTSFEQVVEANAFLFLYLLISRQSNMEMVTLTSLLIELDHTLHSPYAVQILLDMVFPVEIHGGGSCAGHRGSCDCNGIMVRNEQICQRLRQIN
jgi:hypothetical protein